MAARKGIGDPEVRLQIQIIRAGERGGALGVCRKYDLSREIFYTLKEPL